MSDSNHNVEATSNSKSKLAILKVGLSPSKKMFYFNENILKLIEKWFKFHPKSSFRSQDI